MTSKLPLLECATAPAAAGVIASTAAPRRIFQPPGVSASFLLLSRPIPVFSYSANYSSCDVSLRLEDQPAHTQQSVALHSSLGSQPANSLAPVAINPSPLPASATLHSHRACFRVLHLAVLAACYSISSTIALHFVSLLKFMPNAQYFDIRPRCRRVYGCYHLRFLLVSGLRPLMWCVSFVALSFVGIKADDAKLSLPFQNQVSSVIVQNTVLSFGNNIGNNELLFDQPLPSPSTDFSNTFNPIALTSGGFDTCVLHSTGVQCCCVADLKTGPTPIQLDNNASKLIRSIFHGGKHVCAIDGDFQLWCWGNGLWVLRVGTRTPAFCSAVDG